MVQMILGLVVVAAGVLLLVEAATSGEVSGLYWTGLLAVGSAAFWFAFFTHRSWWWAAIPAGALLGASLSEVVELAVARGEQWTGTAFLAALGTGFLAIYLKDHRRWWAVIPGGALVTLAIVARVTDEVGGNTTGAVLLFGLAITFLLVAVLPGGRSRRWWAGIVAAALSAIALVVVLQAADMVIVLTYVWPLAVMGGGGYLLWTALRHRRAEDHPTPSTQAHSETSPR